MLFKIYKKKQGLLIRWSFFAICSVLFLYGASRLYRSFPIADKPGWAWAYKKFFSYTIPLIDLSIVIDPRLLISLGCAIFFLALFSYLSFKHQKLSDFLIDTESEMRKVSWPTSAEVIKSSTAVIVIVVLIGIFLYLCDILLNAVFNNIFY